MPPRAVTLTPEQRAGFPRSVAKTIANSPLVKTALFGNDPNWGRILAAAGRAGVAFDPDRVEIALAGTTVYRNGMPTDFNGYVVSEAMKAKEVADFDRLPPARRRNRHRLDLRLQLRLRQNQRGVSHIRNLLL